MSRLKIMTREELENENGELWERVRGMAVAIERVRGIALRLPAGTGALVLNLLDKVPDEVTRDMAELEEENVQLKKRVRELDRRLDELDRRGGAEEPGGHDVA